MQTFLPYKSFYQSLDCLDYRRLGKQRVETFQLLKVLGPDPDVDLDDVDFSTKKAGWANHPAAKMWRGYSGALALYGDVSIDRWLARGYQNTMLLRFRGDVTKVRMPPWLGDPAFHLSHQSNLLRKDPEFYGKYGWNVGPDLEYIWPPEAVSESV